MPKKKTETTDTEKTTVKKPAAKSARKSAEKKSEPAAKTPAVKTAAKKAPAKGPAKAKKSTKSAAPASGEERYEQLRLAAYFRWEQKGCPEGSHLEDWLEAEDALSD